MREGNGQRPIDPMEVQDAVFYGHATCHRLPGHHALGFSAISHLAVDFSTRISEARGSGPFQRLKTLVQIRRGSMMSPTQIQMMELAGTGILRIRSF